ncbi:protein translocase subunit SecF [Moraxella osloensis]|uniref:protein translocase subunit SecF n=1 Tax=Faucicola osloensis TaxID=34062 RepID=UPI002003FA56|nr:protein translocase subunit SecF [Moraxella osloensis]MCK6051374.1 protein translocase subunit SecF [Moraxella osloensis]
MNDDKLEDLEGLDGSEPINPEQKLSELGVRRSDEIASNTQHRKTPRRNGKGVNKNLVKQPATPSDTIPQNAGLAVANAASAEFSAENFGGEKFFAGRRIIDFLKVAKPFAILSAILTILGLVAILTKGLNLGLDFTGGVSATVVYEKPVQQAQVQSALANHKINDSVVQYLGSNKEILVRLPPQKQIEGLSNSLDAALDLPNNNATIKNIDVVGSQVGNEIYVSSLGATALALLCMFIYVMVRFQAKLALGAVLALFHDSIITVGIFALFGWPFDLTVLAAVLSLIGYSINDTIVVFDRIRENFRRVRGASPTQIVNLSLTETLRRTIMTISTVLLVVVSMLLLGGDSLHWFSVALLIGLILGTFSSVYIASAIPLWLGMSRKDFIVEVKPEFVEDEVVFEDRNAPINAPMYDNKALDNQ